MSQIKNKFVENGAIDASKLASNSVTTVKILDSNVTTDKLANLAVTNAKVATGIGADKIANGSVQDFEYQYLNGLTGIIQDQLDDKTETSVTSEIDQNVDDLITLSGVAENATTLGTFTGSTIPDSQTIKQALQALETKAEANTALINGLEWQDSALDYIVNNTVVPPTEVSGDRYILSHDGGAPHANYDGASAGNIVEFNGSVWVATAPTTGMFISADDESSLLYYWGGSAWLTKAFEATTASTGLTKVGLDIRLADAAENSSGIQVSSGVITLNDLGAFDTDDLSEGATNKYFTDARAIDAVETVSSVTAVSSDYVIIGDTSDAGNLKKALVSDIVSLVSPALYGKETFVLAGGDITNQYVDFAQVAKTGSVVVCIKGSGSILEGASYDYSLSYTGGAGGKTRLTFLNDLATGGNSALVATDVLQVSYSY